MPDLATENAELKAKLAAVEASKKQAELDEAEAKERVFISYGALTLEQARECVKAQRAWEKDPKHPDNVAKAKNAAAQAK